MHCKRSDLKFITFNDFEEKGEIFTFEFDQKGDHIHNLGVLRKKRGYLVVSRAPDGINSYPEDFLPCVFCKSWISKMCMARHQKRYKEYFSYA